jgi:hypothetical protein
MKAKKLPKVAYRLLTRGDHPEAYDRLDALVEAHHEELRDAKIALAWCTSWKRDTDGNLTLGKCRRAAALDRQLHDYDFVILLNSEFWNGESTTALQRDALLDHELCHATVKIDPETDDPVVDETGRTVYRMRRHDLEEFACIAERYGIWKRDIELFHRSLRRADKQRLLPLDEQTTEAGPPAVH